MATSYKLLKKPLDSTPYVVDRNTTPFHLLELIDNPFETRRMQTCLGSWFVAYVIAFEDASQTCEELAHDGVIYQVLDDLFCDMLAYDIDPDRTSDDYQTIFLKPLRFFSSGLVDERKTVRNWFADFVSSFDERANDISMNIHCYAFNTLDAYLQTYIAQRQNHILEQLTHN